MILMKILISMLNCKDINRIYVYYLYIYICFNSSLIVTRIVALYINLCFRNSIMPPSDCNTQFRVRIYYFDLPDGGAHVLGAVLHISERCLWGNYYG